MHYTKLFILQEMRPQPSNTSGLRFISGIICKSKVLRFERMLFRATRGNMLFNQAPAGEQIMDPVSTEMVFFFLITFIWWLIICHPPPNLYLSFWPIAFPVGVYSHWCILCPYNDSDSCIFLFRLRKQCSLCFSPGNRREQRFWKFVRHLVQIVILFLKI